jgi:hypothetical protein
VTGETTTPEPPAFDDAAKIEHTAVQP